MSEPSFLERLHAGFGVPRELVVTLAERATGRPVGALSRVVDGYDNEVYRAELDDGEVAYLRIRRHGQGEFDEELWAMDQARAAGVPVPEVIMVDAAPVGDGERGVMVVRAAAGIPLAESADRRQALVDLGRVLRRLHAVRTPGLWRPGGDGRWATVTENRAGYIADRRGERELLVRAGLTPTEVEETYAILERFLASGSVVPVLCHGDLGPRHVFVEDGRVAGLIDWGMWHGGAALGELATAWNAFGSDGLTAIMEGYGGSTDDPGFRRSLAETVVQNLIGHIAHHVLIGDVDGTVDNVGLHRRALRVAHDPDAF